jgi:hypothetical protein
MATPMSSPMWPLGHEHQPLLQRVVAKTRRALQTTKAYADAGMDMTEQHTTFQSQHDMAQALLNHHYPPE